MSFSNNKNNINLNGRPKGSKNKAKVKIDLFINNLIDNNLDLIQEDFLSLKPKDRLQFVSSLLKFVVPVKKEIGLIENQEPITEIRLIDATTPR